MYRGKLTIKTDVPDGLTTDSISNNKENVVTLKSSIARINNTLADSAGVIYKGKQNYTGEDNLNITANDGEKIDQGSIGIIVNDNPKLILSVLKSVTTSSGITITESDAVNLIESWLNDGKTKAFGYTYNQQVVEQYTIGEYKNKSLEKIEWLRQRNAFDEVDIRVVQPVGAFLAQGNQVTIDIKVSESFKRYVGGNIDPGNTVSSTGLYRFTLQVENGSWKIANSQEINK